MSDQESASGTTPYTGSNRDWLAVYALGGLSQDERDQAEEALAADPSLRAELAELQAVVALLPLTSPAMTPSPAGKERLLNRVERAAQTRSARPALDKSPSFTPARTWKDYLRELFSLPLVTGAALAGLVVLIGLTIMSNQRIASLNQQVTDLRFDLAAEAADRDSMEARYQTAQTEADNLRRDRQDYEGRLAQVVGRNVLLTQQVNALQAERDGLADRVAGLTDANIDYAAEMINIQTRLEELQKVTDLFSSPGTSTVIIGGTPGQEQAVGQILYNPDSDVAVMTVADLPQLAEGEVYQVLLIRGAEHDTAETFQVDPAGEGVMLVHAPFPFNTFDTIAVSIEPVGGSPQRTGEIVLLGSVTN